MNIQEISHLLVARRKALAVSQKELAALTGLSLHTIHNLESGCGNPTLQSLLTLIDVLGLTLMLPVKNQLAENGEHHA